MTDPHSNAAAPGRRDAVGLMLDDFASAKALPRASGAVGTVVLDTKNGPSPADRGGWPYEEPRSNMSGPSRTVGQADASLARVSAAVSGETSPNRLKLLDCVGVSPADYTGGGR